MSVVKDTFCPSMMNTASVLVMEETDFVTVVDAPWMVSECDASLNVREDISAL